VLRILGSLRGLRVQLLLWTVLPLTLVLVGVAIIGISTHQRSMRQMVEELDARSARLAAAHLTDELAGRVALLEVLAGNEGRSLEPDNLRDSALSQQFDGGVAQLDASGELVAAWPSVEAWQGRPIEAFLALVNPQHLRQEEVANHPDRALYSPFFIDPATGRGSVLIGLDANATELVVGAVSLEQLGLNKIIQLRTTGHPESAPPSGRREGAAVVFLVDSGGQIIYHPDPALIGHDLTEHEGVKAVIQGQAGATYHREADGQELVVGYAPVPGPGWGLIVQEPWTSLIAPIMRVSLLTPLAVVAAALVSGLAVTFGLHYVVRPLQALDRQATRVAWGDFSVVAEPVGGIQEIEDLRRTLATMAGQIQRYQAGMRDYVAAVTAAQEEERRRLARELHDETVQSLIALGHRVEMVQKALDKDPAKARQRLAELSQLTAATQQEVRRFSRALRPLYLEDLGFVPALEMLAQETEREHGLPVSFKVEGTVRRLPPDMELTAYRLAQEGLSNVIRHAQAQTAELTVVFTGTELRLQLRDDGRGFNPPVNPAELAQQGHFGLMGLHERVLLFGGRLEVRSKPGAGTTLEACLPLRESFSGYLCCHRINM
jgi:signal transduction histidine kinase